MLSDVGVWPGSTPAISAGPAPGLDDDASAGLPLPDAAELLAYMEATFGAFEGRVRAINDDTALDIVVVDFNGDRSTIADAIADATSHADRHLGMIEALRGVLGVIPGHVVDGGRHRRAFRKSVPMDWYGEIRAGGGGHGAPSTLSLRPDPAVRAGIRWVPVWSRLDADIGDPGRGVNNLFVNYI